MALPHTEYMTITINDPIQYHYIYTTSASVFIFYYPIGVVIFVSKFHTQEIRIKVPIPLI